MLRFKWQQYNICVKEKDTFLRVSCPMREKMKESVALLEINTPNRVLFENFFGNVDGERLPCAQYVDANKQNGYY